MTDVELPLSPSRDIEPLAVVAKLEDILQRDPKPLTTQVLEGWFAPYQDPHQVLTLGVEIQARGLSLEDTAQAYVMNQMRKAIKESEGLSYLDNLTHLANRRRVGERLEREISDYESRRTDRSSRKGLKKGEYLSVIVADIDNFKRDVNDKLGYAEGDNALKWVASRLKRVRPKDLPGRWGGEEFIVVCPDTSRSGVYRIAERIRKDIEQTSVQELGYRLTLSFGTATYDVDAKRAEDLINSSIQAAYVAKKKEGGKNCVVQMRPKALREYYELRRKNKEKSEI